MVGHGGSRAGLHLADRTSPIPSHYASIVAISTLRVNVVLTSYCISDDGGRLLCPQCKKSFSRQRQYNTHFCSASSANSDYVDLEQKDVKIELDLFTDEEDEDYEANASADPTVEFK